MFNVLKKRIKNEKGLSLVELLAVIVILGIIAAIAIPAIGNIIANSEAKAEISDAVQILNAGKLYELDGNEIGNGGVTDLGNYVDVSSRIESYTVTKDNGEYKIIFKGDRVNLTTPKTLTELSDYTVSGGVVNWGGTTTTTP